jgi:uncharacterized membrane protein
MLVHLPPGNHNRIYDILNCVAWLMFIAIWIYAIFLYLEFPRQIPLQFDGNGKAFKYSNKLSVFILPLIACYVMIALPNKTSFRHTGTSRPFNSIMLQKFYTQLLKLSILLVTFTLLIVMHLYVRSVITTFPWYMVILIIILIILPFIWLSLRQFRKRNL